MKLSYLPINRLSEGTLVRSSSKAAGEEEITGYVYRLMDVFKKTKIGAFCKPSLVIRQMCMQHYVVSRK